MKFNFNKKYISIGIIALGVIILAILFFFACFQVDAFKEVIGNIFNLLTPVIYGFIFAYLLIPIVNFFDRKLFYRIALRNKDHISNKKKRVFRVFSIIFSFSVVIFLITLLMRSLIPQITASINTMQEQSNTYFNTVSGWVNSITNWFYDFQKKYIGPGSMLDGMIDFEKIRDSSLEFFAGIFSSNANNATPINNLLTNVSSFFIGFFKNVWNMLIGFVISIYVLLNKELFAAQAKKIVYSMFSLEKANHLLRDLRFVSDTFLGFIIGKIVDSIIIGFICYFGLLILDMPYPILLSVVIGLTNIIPFFGPIIGAVPTSFIVLIATFSDNPWKIVYFIIFVIILQQLDGNIIGPAILGSSTGISGMWVIFSITFFGGLWGVVGMFIGIPIFSVFYAMFKRSVERRLVKKNLPTESWEYLPVKRIDVNSKKIVPLIEANDLNYKAKPMDFKEFIEKIKKFKLIKMKHSLNDSADDDIIEEDDDMKNN